MRTALANCAALLAAACETTAPIPRGDACGAADYEGLVGSPLAAATFPAGVRVIGPDTIVTEDYVPSRLNVLINSAGTIVGFRCG